MRWSAATLGACAALLCTDVPPAAAQFVPSWQGFYVGFAAGFVRGKAGFDASDLAVAGITTPGSISGLAANGAGVGFGGGFNWQTGAFVFGLEGDWSHLSLRADVPFSGTIAPFGAVSGKLSADLNWIATARARAGFSVGQALVYGTAGIALAGASGEVAILGLGAPIFYADAAWLAGWVVGGGVEYALSPVWTIKGEFTRVHVGSGPLASSAGAAPLSSSIDLYNFRGGLNYRF
jgi:outer membrane immunogenic protein